ncbi:hypothetical protein [Kribbella deserti]|uniref:Uncharacterized protein n=1 Tax=Kribbella deserti TaxID=1926257 RepID=A0ABV6QMC1_9ACTN
MTETELHSRLTASVADVEPPNDLIDRVRAGGSKRLRRQRISAVATVAVAVLAIGGVLTAGVGLERFDSQADAAANARTTIATDDPYAYFLNKPTKGDLANDAKYLDEVLRAWHKSHGRSANKDRGIFDHLKGEAHVVWAGNTPAGRAAMVIQRAELRHHDNIQLSREGLFTLAGFVGMGADGKATVVDDAYPAPGVGAPPMAFVVGSGRGGVDQKALVVLDTGTPKVGVSMQREYPATGGSTRTYQSVTFQGGAAVVPLAPGATALSIRVSRLPANEAGRIAVAAGPAGNPASVEQRLWVDAADEHGWPAAPGLTEFTQAEREAFAAAVQKASDPATFVSAFSMWHAYATTPNGDRVVVGEFALDGDPTRVFAHITSPGGRSKVVGAGIPWRNDPLPVRVQLPEGQGWLVAGRGAELSFQHKDGTWSSPMTNALLVPATPGAKVRVQLAGQQQVVTLG